MTNTIAVVPNGGWDPRLIICRCGTLVDSFILLTERYVFLVDTLINLETAEQLLAITKPHLRDGRTLLVINTHADWDHCWGNQLFVGPQAAHPAPIIASASCAQRFTADVPTTVARKQQEDAAQFGGVIPTAPTITFHNRLTIAGGDLTVELFLTPGHSEDHLAIFIPELRLLLAGDAAEAPFPFARSSGGLQQLRSSLDAMAALQPTTAFYCHAPEQSGPALLAQNQHYFNLLEERCRAAYARGVRSTLGEEALEAAVDWPFSSATTGATFGPGTTTPYEVGHRRHLRIMLEAIAAEQVTH